MNSECLQPDEVLFSTFPLPVVCSAFPGLSNKVPFQFNQLPADKPVLFTDKAQMQPLSTQQWEEGMETGNFGIGGAILAAYYIKPENIMVVKFLGIARDVLYGNSEELAARFIQYGCYNPKSLFSASIFINSEEATNLLSSYYDSVTRHCWPLKSAFDPNLRF